MLFTLLRVQVVLTHVTTHLPARGAFLELLRRTARSNSADAVASCLCYPAGGWYPPSGDAVAAAPEDRGDAKRPSSQWRPPRLKLVGPDSEGAADLEPAGPRRGKPRPPVRVRGPLRASHARAGASGHRLFLNAAPPRVRPAGRLMREPPIATGTECARAGPSTGTWPGAVTRAPRRTFVGTSGAELPT